MILIRLFFTAIFLLFIFTIDAQVIHPGGYMRDYYEVLSLHNPKMPSPISIHPSIISQYKSDTLLAWNVWKDVYPKHVKLSKSNRIALVHPFISYNYNTITPRGLNDGAMWSGKGSNMLISGGVFGQVGMLHFSFIPLFTVAQNKPISIPKNVTGATMSEYSYPFSSSLDWVQQYGIGAYKQFHLGQSELRIVYKQLTFGISTENFKLGPSVWNPILMSMNAAGIPHLDLGTAAPIQTKIGKIEMKWYWGAAFESKYFDDISTNDRKYITGFSVGYQPSFAPGLSVGLNRIMYAQWGEGDLSTIDFFAAFLKNKGKGRSINDEYDQMVSLMLKYRFPAVGFELYIEYVKNDFPGTVSDVFDQLDRTRAINWGVMKTFELKNNRWLTFSYEFTTLSATQTILLKNNGNPPYYIHSVVTNGYTHQGQLLGAGIGPGSNGSLLKIDLYVPQGKFGINYSRIRYNDDYFMTAYKNEESYPKDHEITVGINYLRHFKSISLQPSVDWNSRVNWFYQDDVEVHSFQIGIKMQYHL